MNKPPCSDKRLTTLKAIYSKSAVWTCPREPRPENKVVLRTDILLDHSMVTA